VEGRSGRRAALTADGLTLLRAALAVPLLVLTAREAVDAAAVVLSVAWWSDFLDGRFARATTAPTRLGRWDPAVDALVGAGLLAGLLVGGAVGWVPLGVAGVAFAAVFIGTGNPAAGMLLQAVAYAGFIGALAAGGGGWRLLPLLSALAILLLDARRFVAVVLPDFFDGVAAAVRPALRRREVD
jgi:phosphatidylglycerophosphate synthase